MHSITPSTPCSPSWRSDSGAGQCVRLLVKDRLAFDLKMKITRTGPSTLLLLSLLHHSEIVRQVIIERRLVLLVRPFLLVIPGI